MIESNGYATGGRPWRQQTYNSADQLSRLEELVGNALMVRQGFLQKLMDPRRDIADECGYPADGAAVNIEMLRQLYDREAVATRVVQVFPKESWQVQPLVYEDEDSDDPTDFEQAWDDLGKSLAGGNSWFQDEEGSPIFEHLKRADILSGIGHFGVLLIGIDDGKNLQEPIEGVLTTNELPPNGEEREALLNLKGLTKEENRIITNADWGQSTPSKTTAKDSSGNDWGGGMGGLSSGAPQYSLSGTDQQYFGVQFGPPEITSDKPSSKERKLLFLRAFDESLVQIVRYEWNVRSSRFGMPVMYRVTLNDPREQHSGVGLPLATVFVHWSRVIHLADNLGSSEIFGVPRQRPVLNRLLDLRKLYSGSAEMYWRGAFPGYSIETHPQLGGEVQIDAGGMRDMMEQYMNGLQRYMTLSGMSAKSLAPQVSDPTAQINTQIEAICIQLGIPKRVFCGSERGELASSQDDSAWNDRLRERQNAYITPRILVPFIDRLILIGVLPEPRAVKKKLPITSSDIKLTAPGGALPGAAAKPPSGGGAGGAGGAKVLPAAVKPPGVGGGGPPSAKPPTGNRLIYNAEGKPVGMETKGGYSIEWPDLDSLGKKDKAGISQAQTAALAQYVSGGVEALVPPMDFLTRIMGLDEEEAQGIINAATEAQEKQQEDAADLADTHGMIPEAPPGFKHPEPPPVVVPPTPMKVKGGEQLVHPETGAVVAKGPPNAVKNLATVGNDAEGVEWITLAGQHIPIKDGVMAAGPHKGEKYDPDKHGGGHGKEKDHEDHGHGHEIEHAAHQAHLAHEAKHLQHTLAHPKHGLTDAYAIASSVLMSATVKAVGKVMGKVPGCRKAGEAIGAIHDKVSEAADKAVGKLSERYGHATAAAILAAGSAVSSTALSKVPGMAFLPAKAQSFIGALPVLAMAEAGKRLGIVGKDTKIERGLEKVGTMLHSIKAAVGGGVSRLGLRAARSAGRAVGKVIGNEGQIMTANNVKLTPAQIQAAAEQLVKDLAESMAGALQGQGADLKDLDQLLEVASSGAEEQEEDQVENQESPDELYAQIANMLEEGLR